ncbi:relaxin-3b [Scleropages formosus]|uniref:relaxin-3b n=1 Tax=Scleropages formosus TaxID=113540 RepID=UPI0008783350|nr:relaxin-3 [Scleropages formosus]
MWKAAVLAVCLLIAGAEATEGHPAYGVKLCGREFIRAVIFTCGGSRWRRAADRADDFTQDPFASRNNEASENWSQNAILGLTSQQRPEAEAPAWAGESRDGAAFVRPARSLISEEVLEALRTSDRKGRDVVVGLSNACCKWGCSKSEISSLC